MGTELIALGLAAAGAGVQAKNQHDAAKEQNAEAIRGLMKQGQDQDEANKRVNAQVDALKNSSPDQARADSMAQFMDQLRQTRAQSISGSGGVGGSRYKSDTDAAVKGVADYGTRTADLLARINAPGVQRQEEGQGFAQLSSDLGTIGRNAAADDFLTRLRLQNIRPNPGMDAFGQTLSGAGAGLAVRGKNVGPTVKQPMVPVDLNQGVTVYGSRI